MDGDKSKSHLVAWNQVCRPKNYGGLGLRNLKALNEAQMMKVGWGLITQKNTLWARPLEW